MNSNIVGRYPVTNQKLPKLLVIDDEPQIRALLQEFLSDQFEITMGSNGKEAIDLARRLRPEVILMDVIMPVLDGVSACEQLRMHPETQHIPILLLTAANSNLDRIRAFNMGADDYISKPFEVKELSARLQSKLRRSKEAAHPTDATVMTLANLTLKIDSREVMIENELIDLSPSEFGILQLLMSRLGLVVTRQDIMDIVWHDQTKNNRLIDAHVTSLRKKIENFKGSLQTVYGSGYRMKP